MKQPPDNERRVLIRCPYCARKGQEHLCHPDDFDRHVKTQHADELKQPPKPEDKGGFDVPT